jgi:FkbM family methyltransferase
MLQMLLKNFWHLFGGRRTKAMGLSLNLHPDTVWPGRRGLKLPTDNCRSRIVPFVDFVQANAVCNAIEYVENPVIIDVGAHHGEYALLLGGLLKSKGGGLIIAIEPAPLNVKILKSNIQRNALKNFVQIIECAVSDFSGEMDFVSEGVEGHLAPDSSNKDKATKITVETIRNIITRFKLSKVDLLLIDVEGAELNVLKGFPWENMNPHLIFCELHPYNWPMFGYSGSDLTAFLKEHNYRCLDMYFHEYAAFNYPFYIGPCLFLPR